MKQLHEYTIDELLAEICSRTQQVPSAAGQYVGWDVAAGPYQCSACGVLFSGTHYCATSPSLSNLPRQE